ncbi:class I SAM-dependent methyltransferase [Tepidimonas charontis]|uniref:Trans-aconitate 2-methyltransferase n=1 Tax=Tepidimonas charontis TaxID=2267262 RepID=A0A554XIL1_9BURK|nr:methyltransferase domain-containing protein [Tepidimonas charontis]TSE35662.1 Trans-aconitate 2-methyltransferase [Tepidimonas charontis]
MKRAAPASAPDRWPLPALTLWLAAWAGFAALRLGLQRPVAEAFGIVAIVAVAVALRHRGTAMRRMVMALGFPLSWVLASGLLPLPPSWVWALLLLGGLLLYPWRAWRDAPLYPTPAGAFDGLREQLWLPPRARILDAGCGVGDGLRALERAYPDAELAGIERSWVLALLARQRCPHATVRVGDFWQADWSPYDAVYLFQRPETMPRAAAKAERELRPGAWLLSLEFDVPGWTPSGVWRCPDGRTLWLYQRGSNGAPLAASA